MTCHPSRGVKALIEQSNLNCNGQQRLLSTWRACANSTRLKVRVRPSEAALYNRKAKIGGMDGSEAKRLRRCGSSKTRTPS